MSTVVAVANQKGGVGKTTTASQLGIGLVKKGKKVLLVDMDPQGSLTDSLGFEPEEMQLTISTVMEKLIMDNFDSEMRKEIVRHKEGVDLLPANIELAGIEITLINVMSRETTLKPFIDAMRAYYDYIIIDCSPSLGMLTLNALVAADDVLIPVTAEYLPMKGLIQLFNTIAKVKRKINPSLAIAGILVTKVDSRTNDSKKIIGLLTEAYGNNVRIFDSKIPNCVKATEISSEGISIYEYAPKEKITEAYLNFVTEFSEL